MQNTIDNGTPTIRTTIKVTPLQLEQIAKRLRAAEEHVGPGQQITYDLTSEIAIMYDPLVTKKQFTRKRFDPELIENTTEPKRLVHQN